MSKNIKQTSPKIAHLAATTLTKNNSSAIAKSLAASLISQSNSGKQSGAKLEEVASKVLQSEKYNDTTNTSCFCSI